jgi:hypothetical protein
MTRQFISTESMTKQDLWNLLDERGTDAFWRFYNAEPSVEISVQEEMDRIANSLIDERIAAENRAERNFGC